MTQVANYDVMYTLEPLLQNGSAEMSVNGTSPNKFFKYQPDAGEIRFLERINFFLLDTGTMSDTVFGALGAALSNGIRVVVKNNGTEYIMKTIVDNVDIYMTFPDEKTCGASGAGFLNSDDYFQGSLYFKTPIRLLGDRGDLVKIVIRDDLTGIGRMRSSALLWYSL